VHRRFSRQLAKARTTSGEIDLDVLDTLVTGAYDQSDRDRRSNDRSISLMIEELDRLNRSLEQLVEERTAALQQREDELRAQNLRFDAAINNMSQALMMYDADGRLVIGNDRYHELYRLPPNVIKPGCTIREVLEHRKRNGTLPDDPEQHLKKLMAAVSEGRLLNRLIELADGRSIAIVMRPLPDGGWLVTHEDVTEQHQAERQIAHMARHDALTNLPNRMLLRDRLSQALAGVERGARIAVLYLDLDHFKTVNDTLGHHIGDDLLKAVAGRPRCSVRDVDTVAWTISGPAIRRSAI
jgi:predicted signal transduction protein with EAL and GGDEF domain